MFRKIPIIILIASCLDTSLNINLSKNSTDNSSEIAADREAAQVFQEIKSSILDIIKADEAFQSMGIHSFSQDRIESTIESTAKKVAKMCAVFCHEKDRDFLAEIYMCGDDDSRMNNAFSKLWTLEELKERSKKWFENNNGLISEERVLAFYRNYTDYLQEETFSGASPLFSSCYATPFIIAADDTRSFQIVFQDIIDRLRKMEDSAEKEESNNVFNGRALLVPFAGITCSPEILKLIFKKYGLLFKKTQDFYSKKEKGEFFINGEVNSSDLDDEKKLASAVQEKTPRIGMGSDVTLINGLPMEPLTYASQSNPSQDTLLRMLWGDKIEREIREKNDGTIGKLNILDDNQKRKYGMEASKGSWIFFMYSKGDNTEDERRWFTETTKELFESLLEQKALEYYESNQNAIKERVLDYSVDIWIEAKSSMSSFLALFKDISLERLITSPAAINLRENERFVRGLSEFFKQYNLKKLFALELKTDKIGASFHGLSEDLINRSMESNISSEEIRRRVENYPSVDDCEEIWEISSPLDKIIRVVFVKIFSFLLDNSSDKPKLQEYFSSFHLEMQDIVGYIRTCVKNRMGITRVKPGNFLKDKIKDIVDLNIEKDSFEEDGESKYENSILAQLKSFEETSPQIDAIYKELAKDESFMSKLKDKFIESCVRNTLVKCKARIGSKVKKALSKNNITRNSEANEHIYKMVYQICGLKKDGLDLEQLRRERNETDILSNLKRIAVDRIKSTLMNDFYSTLKSEAGYMKKYFPNTYQDFMAKRQENTLSKGKQIKNIVLNTILRDNCCKVSKADLENIRSAIEQQNQQVALELSFALTGDTSVMGDLTLMLSDIFQNEVDSSSDDIVNRAIIKAMELRKGAHQSTCTLDKTNQEKIKEVISLRNLCAIIEGCLKNKDLKEKYSSKEENNLKEHFKLNDIQDRIKEDRTKEDIEFIDAICSSKLFEARKEVLDIMLKAGLDPKARNIVFVKKSRNNFRRSFEKFGGTLLHSMVCHWQPDLIKFLLEHLNDKQEIKKCLCILDEEKYTAGQRAALIGKDEEFYNLFKDLGGFGEQLVKIERKRNISCKFLRGLMLDDKTCIKNVAREAETKDFESQGGPDFFQRAAQLGKLDDFIDALKEVGKLNFDQEYVRKIVDGLKKRNYRYIAMGMIPKISSDSTLYYNLRDILNKFEWWKSENGDPSLSYSAIKCGKQALFYKMLSELEENGKLEKGALEEEKKRNVGSEIYFLLDNFLSYEEIRKKKSNQIFKAKQDLKSNIRSQLNLLANEEQKVNILLLFESEDGECLCDVAARKHLLQEWYEVLYENNLLVQELMISFIFRDKYYVEYILRHFLKEDGSNEDVVVEFSNRINNVQYIGLTPENLQKTFVAEAGQKGAQTLDKDQAYLKGKTISNISKMIGCGDFWNYLEKEKTYEEALKAYAIQGLSKEELRRCEMIPILEEEKRILKEESMSVKALDEKKYRELENINRGWF